MSDKRNLGRGLGDMIEEVSTVNAVPMQTAAAADAAGEPMLVEERPADAVINSKQPVRVEREIVKVPVVPGWAWRTATRRLRQLAPAPLPTLTCGRGSSAAGSGAVRLSRRASARSSGRLSSQE